MAFPRTMTLRIVRRPAREAVAGRGGAMPGPLRGVVFLSPGVALLIACGFTVAATRDFLRRGRVTTGLVIAGPQGPHHAMVRFRAAGGRAGCRVVTYRRSGVVALHVGETIRVPYDPRNPAPGPRVDRLGAVWGTVGLLGPMGGVFAAVGALLLRPARPVAGADEAEGGR